MQLLQLISVTLVCVAEVSSYNILIMLPFGSKSHKNVFDPIAEVLGSRGHQVTIMAPLKDTKSVKGVRNVNLHKVEEVMSNPPFTFFDGTVGEASFMDKMVRFAVDLCSATYQEPEVLSIIGNPRDPTDPTRPRYDVLVADLSVNDYTLPLAHLMGVPSIYISTSILFPHVAWSLNIPTPYSYVSTGMSYDPSSMSFFERAKNAFMTLYLADMFHRTLFAKFEAIVHQYIPNSPPILQLERNVSFVMTNTHQAIHPSRPSMPFVLEIGGVHCLPAKKLPKDFEEFLNEAGLAGVVYFSLGSVTKGTTMPAEMKRKVLDAFSRLPQKVLWKFEEAIDDLPLNIRLTKWAPQQSLLAHPQVKLFISHGGGLSTQEAAYHGCPLLGLPLSADQLGNIANAVNSGYAETLDWKTFTADELYEKIHLMIQDERYQENAKRVSLLMKDYTQPPAEVAAYWIEYVIRHGGAPHLKSDAQQLNFFQYFLLDVIAAVAATLLAVLVITFYTIKTIYQLLRKFLSTATKPPEKHKTN